MVVAWCAMAFLVGISAFLTRRLDVIPRGGQNVIELIVEKLLAFVTDATGSSVRAKKLFPLAATIFLFVLAVNWMGLLPGAGTVGIFAVEHGERVLTPFWRASSADLNFTLALSLISVIAIQIFGIQAIGVKHYIGKFITFKDPIAFFVGILEIISEIGKIISLSFRLFGNIFAGEVLLTVMLTLVPYVVPVPFLAMEVFVGFVQAFVFSMLTLVFASMAMEEAH